MPSSRGSFRPRDWTHVSASPALQADSLPLSHQGSPCRQRPRITYICIQTTLEEGGSLVNSACLCAQLCPILWPHGLYGSNPHSWKSPALTGRFFTTVPPGKPPVNSRYSVNATSSLRSLGEFKFVAVQSLSRARPHGLQLAGLPVLHHLPELAQTQVHWVGDPLR